MCTGRGRIHWGTNGTAPLQRGCTSMYCTGPFMCCTTKYMVDAIHGLVCSCLSVCAVSRVASCALLVARRALRDACRVLRVACCLSRAACCVLRVACCVLHVVRGVWRVLWSVVSGLWSVVCGLWCAVRGARCAVRGAWCVVWVCDTWCVVCGGVLCQGSSYLSEMCVLWFGVYVHSVMLCNVMLCYTIR